MYLAENTSQAVSVEFVRLWRTNYARNRLQKLVEKARKGFFDSLTPAGLIRRAYFVLCAGVTLCRQIPARLSCAAICSMADPAVFRNSR